MAYLRELKSGKFQSTIRIKGINLYRTFQTKRLANAWAKQIEQNIKKIPTLSNKQLIALSDDEIELMGGAGLFKSLGVDLFEIRNAHQLEIINQLNKKELLQLTAQEIESMGGVELFTKAGKRIRYKMARRGQRKTSRRARRA